ncbi:MAG TPA: L-threonylcarbamoyladenylate synthase [Dehalococcoidia bacterium]
MSSPIAVHADIEQAVARLRDGGVVAFPTDTLYALGADATNAEAVGRVFDIKGREAGKPLPLFVAGAEIAAGVAVMTPLARRLAERFWPGALTLVVQKLPSFESEALVGGETVALRVPNSDVALEILRGLGRPVTATSANLSGGADPADASTVRAQIGERLDLIVDGGACDVGVSSTIVDCTGEAPLILRAGAISEAEIAAALSA